MKRTNKQLAQREAVDSGVNNCVWMDAGVVDYKLCDRSYDCDHCPFDEALHGQRSELPFREDLLHVQGCDVAHDLFYHPNHVWMRIEENGEVRIGLDDFGQRLLGTTYALALPAEETAIKSGDRCCRLALQSGVVALLSPASGKVKKTNSSLGLRPSLVNRDPYGSGWMMLIEPLDLEASLKRSFYGQKVGPWLTEEIETLRRLISSLTNDKDMPATMNDGGLLTTEFLKGLTVEQTRRVISSFFPLANEAEQKSAIVVSGR
jgi:glycine cleavage system H lipoate-binding protein